MGRWVLLLVLLLAYLSYQQNITQGITPQLNWVVESNPSAKEDIAYGVCYSDKYIYVVGYDNFLGDPQWRIEMREKDTGKLVKAWTNNPSKGIDELSDCIVIGDKLYVVGTDEVPGDPEWAILLFDLNLTLIKIERSNPSSGGDMANRIVTDGKYLYIAGYDARPGIETEWRVEKRRLDLSLERVYVSRGYGWIEGIGINPATHQIWIVGYIIGARGTVEILDENLNHVKNFTNPYFFPFGVVFDHEGNGYVYGLGVIKFDKSGNPLVAKLALSFAGVYINKRLYLLEYSFVSEYIANIELVTREPVYLTSLNKSVVIYREVSTRGTLPKWKAVFDGQNIYVAGAVNKSGDYKWLIASISVPVSVKLAVLDGFNNYRQWTVELLNATGAVIGVGQGSGEFEVLSGKKYIARVKAFGAEFNKEFIASDGLAVAVVVPTAKVQVMAIDGFGHMRSWPVELVGIAKGNGSIGPIEVLGNRTYTAKALSFGRWFNVTFFAAPGKMHNVTVSIPTAFLTVRVVDGFGKARDWPLEIVGLASGRGAIGPVEVLAGLYTTKVTALGAKFNKTVEVQAGKNVTVVVQVPTALISAIVVDGFGAQRDWQLEIRGVATGRGVVGPVEVLGGRQYVVTTTAFGKNFTEAIDLTVGVNATVVVRVPTAKIIAKVVDGFGKARDWPLEIVGLASGRGAIGPVEVLAGRYVARAMAFGKEFTREFTVEPGKVSELLVQVPTAVLNVVVVDDDKRPLDQYVEYVAINGNSSHTPPRELELLAGRYTVKARALGREAVTEVELSPGEVKTVELIIPGTAGFDIGRTRITYTTATALVAVALAAIAGIAILALRRRKRQNK